MNNFKKKQFFLVLNSGSSSIKFQLFSHLEKKYQVICKGLAERIGIDGNLILNFGNQKVSFKENFSNHEKAINKILKEFQNYHIIKNFLDITAIGHRVVHGGKKFVKPTLVTDKVIQELVKLQKLAPLHNPGSLAVIRALKKYVNVPNILVFDTAFHSTIPLVNAIYPIPYKWYEENNVQKYGFHGISYQYVVRTLAKLYKNKNINAVVCHLGNGSSVAAIQNNQSIDTTMGLTPLAGLMMGTRCGDLDFSVIPYISEELQLSLSEIAEILNKKSGLLALSGISSDMREIEEFAQKGNARANLALNIYSQRVADYIVRYANLLQGRMKYLIFTAGIGENSELIVEKILNRLHILPLQLKKTLFADKDKKSDGYFILSEENAPIIVSIISTNEELMICEATAEFLTKNPDL